MIVRKRWIKVKTEFRGIHSWPECPYDEVAFLRDPHRHTFKVEVKVAVGHHDREVEFFMFQHDVDFAINELYFFEDKTQEATYRNPQPTCLGRKSCEEIAEDIYNALSKKYNREMVISVSEDGEVAAEIEFEPGDLNE